MGIIKLKKAEKNKEQSVENQKLDSELSMQEVTEEWEDPAVLYEDTGRTNEHSRHYVLNNGTAKTVLSAEATNYYDEAEQKWKDIDNSLVEKDEVYERSCGNYKTQISKANKGKGVRVSKGEKVLSWEYLGKQAVEGVLPVHSLDGTVLKVHNEQKGKKVSRSNAVYEGVEKGTDLEYCLHGNNLKENIVVKEKSESYRYVFALKTEGMKLRLSENNETLELYSETQRENGEVESHVEFSIPSPYMYDAAGVTSADVYYELEPSEEGKYIFTVVANTEWINAGNRVFPVTIDPQIVVNENNVVMHKVEQRSISTGSSSGTTSGSWQTSESEKDIRVYISSTVGIEYRTILTIKKSLLNLMEGVISNVTLSLVSIGEIGRFYCDDDSYYIERSGQEMRLDITKQFKENTDDFILEFTTETQDREIAFSMTDNPPVLEIEYLTNENVKPTKKSFTLAGIATGEVNLATGDMVTTICDVKPQDSVMGLGIYHVHKRAAEDYSVGGGFRLNLNESLVRNSANDYIYTDASGNKHGFRDYYYYINETGNKTYIKTKSDIEVSAIGELTYIDEEEKKYKVVCEYKSTEGLQVITTLEGLKNIDFFEQRDSKIKENQEKLNGYYNALCDYVIVKKLTGELAEGGELKGYLDSKEQFSTFINILNDGDSNLLLSRSEATAYISLFKQKAFYKSYCTSQYVIPNNGQVTNKNLLSVKYQLYEITQLLLSCINVDEYPGLYKQEALEALNNNEKIRQSCFEGITATWETTIGEVDSRTVDSKIRERNLLLYKLEKETENIDNQISSAGQQMDLYVDRRELYIQQIKNYYKEYLLLLEEQKRLNFELPVNYLTNGKIIKGYNATGSLVAVFDRYGDYAAIEYEKYYVGLEEKRRIARVYDKDENQVVFTYNSANLLSSITDVHGRKTRFTYSNNQLVGISYDTGEELAWGYSTSNFIAGFTESKNALMTNIIYNSNRPTQILQRSMVSKIALGSTGNVNKFLSQIVISYTVASNSVITNVIITDGLIKEKYDFNSEGNCTGYRKADNNIVVDEKHYSYSPYWIGDEKQTDPTMGQDYA